MNEKYKLYHGDCLEIMKTLTLQGHEIEYPDDWADDWMYIKILPAEGDKKPRLRIEFYDKNKNKSGVVEKEISPQ